MKQNVESRSSLRSPRTVAMSLLVVFAMFVGAGMDRILLEVGSASDRFSNASNYDILGETYDLIRDYYVLQDEFTDEQLVWGATSGMVDSLGDTGHSRFMNPTEAQEMVRSEQNELIGIGINVDLTGELPVIRYPIKNSPAMDAGIQPGDTILKVDGVDLTGMDVQDALDLVTGEEGTDVTLELRHANSEETYEVTITRTRIKLDPVQYAMLPNGVLWLQLEQFSNGSAKRVVEGLNWGKEQGMTGVILDLRGNPGGFVVEAIGVASQFLPDGTPLVQRHDSTGLVGTTTTLGNKGVYQEGPLVVLVDENSASAAEITSSALMETGRADLVGEVTAGTGTVLNSFELSDGSMVNIGVQLFLTGQGTDIYHVGVKPNHLVEFSSLPNEFPIFPAMLNVDGKTMIDAAFDDLVDPQLHYAMDLLQKGE